jgi:hypothetical protein
MKKVVSKKDIEKEIKNSQSELLNEGFWEDLKYYTAKVTKRYKADGKFFGKAKVDAKAKSTIEKILNKASNDTIKKLDDTIKSTNPEFPNNRKQDEFLATVLHIASIYDSIVNATKKAEGEQGRLEIDAANKIIRDLRKYVKKFLDTDLYAVYTGLDEEEEINLNDETNFLNELDADETRSNLASRRGKGKDFKSTRMNTLKSNKLPIVLAGVGAGLGALGWVAQTEWLKELLEYLFNKNEVTYKNVYQQIVNKLNFNVDPGDGFTQTVNKTLGLNLGPNTTTDQFMNLMKQKGFGSSAEEIVRNYGIGGLSPNSRFVGDAALALNQKGALLKDVFEGIMHGKAGTLMAVNPGPFLAKQIAYKIVKQAVVTTTTTGTAIATGLAAAGPVLAGIGVALIGAGALVKLFRLKGQKQSRAATLNDLYQMIRVVKPSKNNDTILGLPPAPPQKQIGGGTAPKQLGQGEKEPEMTISGGDKRKGEFDSNKLDAQDTEFEPVEPENEPQGQRQLGAGAKRLGQGQPPKGEEKPIAKPKKPYTQLNNTLTNFFKNLIDIRRQDQENLNEEFEAIKGLKTPQNKLMMNNFIVSVKKLRSLAKFINALSKRDTKNQELNDLLKNLIQNKAHLTIIDIANLLEKYSSNSDMINKFVQIYINNIKNNKFQNLQSIIDSQLNEAEGAKRAKLTLNPQTFLKEFNQNFKIYLKYLYQLFELINKLRNTEQKGTTEEQPLNEKKTKYSKKASSFIGKEISHLKKDKGYPQDRAVAAAINVAKDKGMKVGTKKPKAKTK